MLQDGIDLAMTLVQATVDMQRFSFGTSSATGAIPGVGGSVDMLAVNPTELTWVKKKSLTTR
jgi:GH25 family lysozyme M1 (1,4-beta-N-acetylmuramidase)